MPTTRTLTICVAGKQHRADSAINEGSLRGLKDIAIPT